MAVDQALSVALPQVPVDRLLGSGQLGRAYAEPAVLVRLQAGSARRGAPSAQRELGKQAREARAGTAAAQRGHAVRGQVEHRVLAGVLPLQQPGGDFALGGHADLAQDVRTAVPGPARGGRRGQHGVVD